MRVHFEPRSLDFGSDRARLGLIVRKDLGVVPLTAQLFRELPEHALKTAGMQVLGDVENMLFSWHVLSKIGPTDKGGK